MNAPDDNWSLDRFLIPEATLAAWRKAIFHSTGRGFVVFRRFLDEAQVRHMREFWTAFDPTKSQMRQFVDKRSFIPGCPNFYWADGTGNRVYHNFLWNPPIDELTWSLTWSVQGLRNRISGRNFFAETLGHAPFGVNGRVTISRESAAWIAPHRDYYDASNPFDRTRYDLSRVQATLILSQSDIDYEGDGFSFEGNDGVSRNLAKSENLVPGDLVIWRYNNLHSVGSVRALPGGVGFMRMIFPHERMLHPAAATQEPRLIQVARRVLRKIGLRSESA